MAMRRKSGKMALSVFFHSFLELQLRLGSLVFVNGASMCTVHGLARCGSRKLWEDTDRAKKAKGFEIDRRRPG
ncbi:hypothetical protein V6N13_107591 [Hibiscus sabdariffa]